MPPPAPPPLPHVHAQRCLKHGKLSRAPPRTLESLPHPSSRTPRNDSQPNNVDGHCHEPMPLHLCLPAHFPVCARAGTEERREGGGSVAKAWGKTRGASSTRLGSTTIGPSTRRSVKNTGASRTGSTRRRPGLRRSRRTRKTQRCESTAIGCVPRPPAAVGYSCTCSGHSATAFV